MYYMMPLYNEALIEAAPQASKAEAPAETPKPARQASGAAVPKTFLQRVWSDLKGDQGQGTGRTTHKRLRDEERANHEAFLFSARQAGLP